VPSLTGGTTPITILVNAGKSRIVGLELETSFAVTDNLFLVANYGYQDGEFTAGIDPDLADTTGGDGNIDGKTIPYAPKHSLVLALDAMAQVGSTLDGFIRADFLYETRRYIRSDNLNWVGEREVVNLRTGLQSDDWTLTFYVRNLTDDDTPITALTFVNFATDMYPNGEFPSMSALQPFPGRDWGVEFQYRFGQ